MKDIFFYLFVTREAFSLRTQTVQGLPDPREACNV
jgi:hypothetical protein